MRLNPARILLLPRWVANRIRDAVGAKMTVTFCGQAGELPKLVFMATNHENPSTNSDCGSILPVPAARAEQGRFILPVGASVLSTPQTGTGKLAQPSAYVLRLIRSAKTYFRSRAVLLEPADHSLLLRSRYPARWVVSRQISLKPLEFCRVGYFFFAVEVVKQSLCRLSQAFRLSLPRTPAESLDVYDVAYGDFPFLPASTWKQITTHRSQGVGKFRQTKIKGK